MVCVLSVDQLTHVEADAMALDASPADAVSVQQATHIMVLDYLGKFWKLHGVQFRMSVAAHTHGICKCFPKCSFMLL